MRNCGLRRNKTSGESKTIGGADAEETPRIAGLLAVLRAWLAEHRVDDGEPVTADNVPPWYNEDVEMKIGDALESMEKDPMSVVKTWGQLRLLCRALDIPIASLGEPK